MATLNGVTALGLDLVHGSKTLDLIKCSFSSEKYLFAGIVDGRSIWANDLSSSSSTLQDLKNLVRKGNGCNCTLFYYENG